MRIDSAQESISPTEDIGEEAYGLQHHLSSKREIKEDYSDIIQYMPRYDYRPRRRMPSETDDMCRERVRDGAIRYERRRAKLAGKIRDAIKSNQDASKLSDEIEAALQSAKHEATDKVKANERQLARMGIAKTKFDKLHQDDPSRQRIMMEITRQRTRKTRISKFKNAFMNANEDEKLVIMQKAFELGITLNELTRGTPKRDPSMYSSYYAGLYVQQPEAQDQRCTRVNLGNAADEAEKSFTSIQHDWSGPADIRMEVSNEEDEDDDLDWLSLRPSGSLKESDQIDIDAVNKKSNTFSDQGFSHQGSSGSSHHYYHLYQ